MKLKSLVVAVMMLAFAGATMAATPVKKQAHKKAHVAKIHKAKHKKAAAQ